MGVRGSPPEDMSNEPRLDKNPADGSSSRKERQRETWWNDWVDTIETERTSDSSDERLKGTIRQLVTEAVIYSILALFFTCAIYVIGEITITTVMSHPLQEGPLYMGSVLAVLFTTMWDSWLRKTSNSHP